MSRKATAWAWEQSLKPSLKLVLLSMADRAGEDHTCWPSCERLVRDTGLNKKTVYATLKKLVELNIIADTDKKKGRTSSVIIYKLIGLSTPKNGSAKNIDTLKANELSTPESGSTKHTQKRVSLGVNTPKNGSAKVTQKRVIEPVSNNLLKKTNKKEVFDFSDLPTSISITFAEKYISYRKQINKKIKTQKALNARMEQFSIAPEHGYTAEQAFEVCTKNEWVGFEACWLENIRKKIEVPESPTNWIEGMHQDLFSNHIFEQGEEGE